MMTVWMNEGGQSSTGQLLVRTLVNSSQMYPDATVQDFMIDTHVASDKLKAMAKEQGTNHFALLGQIVDKLVKESKAPFISYLIRNINLYPDLHGNRSPL